MNILIVSQYYWPESFIITGLAEELQMRGHKVTVLTGFPNYPQGHFFKGYNPLKGLQREKRNDVEIIRIPLWARGKSYSGLILNYLTFVVSALFFSIFLNFKKTDLIFCYAPSPATSCLPAVFLRWKLKKKLLFWVQDLWPESIAAVGALSSQKIQNAVGRVIKFIYKRCDLILIQSEGFKDSVVKWGGQLSQIKVVPNWADPFPEMVEIPDWIKQLPKGFRIAFAGNLGKAQDLSNLIEAAILLKNNPEIKWIVVGDGSERLWIEQQIKIKQLQNSVYLIERKPYEQMLPLFQSVDILYASLADQPIFSLTVPAKVQAYMSAGKPLLVSLSGEGKTLVEYAQCGVSCTPQNPVSLAVAVLLLKAKTDAERLQMGLNGQNYFKKNFDRKIVIDLIESLFKSF